MEYVGVDKSEVCSAWKEYLRETNVMNGLVMTESGGGLALSSVSAAPRDTGKPSSWNLSSVISVTGARVSLFTLSSYSDMFQLDRNSKLGSFIVGVLYNTSVC